MATTPRTTAAAGAAAPTTPPRPRWGRRPRRADGGGDHDDDGGGDDTGRDRRLTAGTGPAAPRPVTNYDADMAAGRRTILLVEDEPAIAEPLAETLDREGFDLHVAGTRRRGGRRGAPSRPDLDPARPHAARRLGLRRLPRGPPQLAGADHHAHRARRRGRPGRRASSSAPTTTSSSRSARARSSRASARSCAARGRRRAGAGRRRAARGRRRAARPGDALRDARRRRRRRDPQGVRPARAAHAQRGAVVTPRAAHRRGLGRELVRLDEDARRPRQRAASQARRRRRRAAVHPHRARRRLPLRRPGEERPA